MMKSFGELTNTLLYTVGPMLEGEEIASKAKKKYRQHNFLKKHRLPREKRA